MTSSSAVAIRFYWARGGTIAIEQLTMHTMISYDNERKKRASGWSSDKAIKCVFFYIFLYLNCCFRDGSQCTNVWVRKQNSMSTPHLTLYEFYVCNHRCFVCMALLQIESTIDCGLTRIPHWLSLQQIAPHRTNSGRKSWFILAKVLLTHFRIVDGLAAAEWRARFIKEFSSNDKWW